MEKIFDPEVEKYLLDAKVSKKEIARILTLERRKSAVKNSEEKKK